MSGQVQPEVLAHYDLGGQGPVLLLLHANGFHGQVFRPMANGIMLVEGLSAKASNRGSTAGSKNKPAGTFEVDNYIKLLASAHLQVEQLVDSFHCIALDAPGHGASSALTRDTTPHTIADMVYATLCHLQLQGCSVFGHSMGGGLALLVEAKHPGTFKAIACFEPPITTPAKHEQLLRSKGPDSPGSLLEQLALKRRWKFESPEEAVARLGSKPPFSLFDPRVLDAYVRYGTKPSEGGGVELLCRPESEAQVFRITDPPPACQFQNIKCPVYVACGAAVAGPHQRLVGIAEEVVQALGNIGRLCRFSALEHLGPLEQPDTMAAWLKQVLLATQHTPQVQQLMALQTRSKL